MNISIPMMHGLAALCWLILCVPCVMFCKSAYGRYKDRGMRYLDEHPERWAQLNKLQRWYNGIHPTENRYL